MGRALPGILSRHDLAEIRDVMPFTVSEYAALRPFLYHVTARENVPRLRWTRRLVPAAELLRAAGRLDLVRTRRDGPVRLTIDGEPVVLKDQVPLVENNVNLADGWQFEDFVEFLNCHVFFWPGDAVQAIPAGRALLAHYEVDQPAVLRVPMMDLVRGNPTVPPLFSRYNTGAARMQHGKRVLRGPDLFRAAHETSLRRFEVKATAFRGALVLADNAEIRCGAESWAALTAATVSGEERP